MAKRRVVAKLAINVQGDPQDLPAAEEVAAKSAELLEQCGRVIRDAGGKVQRVFEWTVDEE